MMSVLPVARKSHEISASDMGNDDGLIIPLMASRAKMLWSARRRLL